MFCSLCGGECPYTRSFCHQCGQQLNYLSQVSDKAASSVDKEKLLKKFFHRVYPYAALIMCTSDCGSGCTFLSLVVHFIADFRRKWLDQQAFKILLLYFITASDCRSRDVLGSCSEFNYWFFAQESAGGNILGFFWVFFMNLSRMCLRDQIFRVLLEHYFWSCAQVTAGSIVLGSFSAFCY